MKREYCIDSGVRFGSLRKPSATMLRKEGGVDYCEFVDERRENIFGLAQIWVIPAAKKGSSKILSLVKACTNRMSQRRFADSR